MSKANQTVKGYDYSPKVSNATQIILAHKGDKARMRLISAPLPVYDSLVEKTTGEVKIKERFAWLAIHKEVREGKAVRTVKVFKSGTAVYLAIKALVDSPLWGDPTGYDIVVERTETFGSYYNVTPVQKVPMTEYEKQLEREHTIDLETFFGTTAQAAPMRNVDDFDALDNIERTE